jgi:hypothetical protein
MNRRKFLQWLGIGAAAAPVVALASEKGVRVYEAKALAPPLVDFNTATMRYKAYDGVALRSAAHPMSAAQFRKLAEPGLTQVFSGVYRPDDWAAVFNPDSLETVNIRIGGPYQTKCKDWWFGHA